jgi:hypothetical protein
MGTQQDEAQDPRLVGPDGDQAVEDILFNKYHHGCAHLDNPWPQCRKD